ncbi:MAG: helix-turn-helix domain-containing protein [Clostridia bacterium]|nr:helix-turn-helix domain-containing protein [Clostridia bacterium]
MAVLVGEKIKDLRIEKGLTQDELADRLCVSRHLVSKWEIGKRYPDFKTLQVIAEVFDVDPGRLIHADRMVYDELETCIPAGMDPKNASKLVEKYIGTLTEADSAVFLMRYVRFMDTKTIAGRLGKSDGTIRNRLVVLRRVLRTFLERCQE